MKINYALLGKRIRNIRQRKGMSQMLLAERIERSTAYISYIENGNKHCSLDTLVLIANELNVSTDDLLVDSLENTIKVYNHKFASVITDCNEYETQILLDIVAAAKISIRNHKHLLSRKNK